MSTKRSLSLSLSDGQLPPTAEELYFEYEEARIAFEALDESELLSDVGRQVIGDFETIASYYALSKFGYEKVKALDAKIHDIEVTRVLNDIDEKKITKSQRRKLMSSVEELPKVLALSNALSNGAFHLKSRYKSVEIKSTPSIENAPTEIAEALENQNLSLKHFFDALKVHQALGADIPVIEGSILFHLFLSKGRYEDYQEDTIGYFASRREANLALAEFILKESEGAARQTPWGLLSEIDDPVIWDTARFEWFNNATLLDMIEWYCDKEHEGDSVDFHTVRHVISSKSNSSFEPKELMEVNLEDK